VVSASTGFGSVDLTVVAIYLIGIMVVGILAGYRKNTSSEQFFLAGKSLRWPIIGAALNSVATLTAEDIVKRVRPQMPDRSLVWVGRLTAAVVILLAMFWSTRVGGKFDSIFIAVAKIPMIFAPAITCVFLWDIFWRRGTWQAAMSTLVFGILMGTAYFVIDLPVKWVVGLFVEDVDTMIVTEIWGIPFMQAGWWLFCLCSVSCSWPSVCVRRGRPWRSLRIFAGAVVPDHQAVFAR